MHNFVIGKRNAEGQFNIIDNFEEYSITKPIIFCFSGNMATDLASANGLAKMARNLIGLDNDQVDVLSISYQTTPSKQGKFSEKEAKIFAQTLLNLVTNKNKALDINLACKNMRMVNFLEFCYGSQAVFMITKTLQPMLNRVGYSKKQAELLLQQIFCVGYAPIPSSTTHSTNFYVKSLDDEKFGYSYSNEIFQENDTSPKYLGTGKLVRNKQTINLYTEQLTSEVINIFNYEDVEHDLTLVNRTSTWKVQNANATFKAEVASQCMAYALAIGVLNSTNNASSNLFTPLDLDKIYSACENIIESGNNSVLGKRDYQRYQDELEMYKAQNTVTKFYDFLEQRGITEQDIISGKHTINQILSDYLGKIDYSSTPYEKILQGQTYATNRAKKAVLPTDKVATLEICCNSGFILNNGDLIQDVRSTTLNSSLYQKLFEGTDLTNSIKYNIIQTINGYSLQLSDNYGSYYQQFNSIKDLINTWDKEYSNCELSIKPNREQKIVIQNICNSFNISHSNIQTSLNSAEF